MKKLLALVLALVMTLSLCVVSSNAAYTDKADIDLKEAADVLTAVGVFQGSDGKFDPKANLTREQAAKLVAYLQIGQKAADALVGGGKFADVAKDRWSAGYVDYCASIGIAAGVGDSKFDPTGSLTALQFGKMLLVCLGYDAKSEGMTGTDWSINTSKLMSTAKLLKGLDEVTANSVVTREQAAKMMLNALKAPMVEYANKSTSISVNGADIVFGGSTASYVTSTVGADQTISDEKLTNDTAYTVELGEKLFPKLVLNTGDFTDYFDEFLRPADTWYYKSQKVGTYAWTADKTYTAKVSASDLYKDLGISTVGNGKKAVYVAVDGRIDATQGAYEIKKANTTDKFGGNGVLTEVYTDDNLVYIVEINTYIGDVTAVTAATATQDAYATITTRGNGTSGTYKTTDFAVDDVVLYTYSYKLDGTSYEGIQSVSKAPEKITGNLSEVTLAKNATVADVKYDFSNKIANVADTTMLKYDVDVVLDNYGYAIDIQPTNTNTAYAVVLKIAATAGDFNKTAKAELLFTDGTTEVVTLTNKTGTTQVFDKDSTKVDGQNYATGNDNGDIIRALDIVKYQVNNAGKYTLDRVAAANSDNTALTNQANALKQSSGYYSTAATKASGTANYTKTTNGSYAFKANNNNYTANGKTLFVVATKSGTDTVYTVYKGIKNVPTINTTTGGVDSVVYCESDGLAKIVYIDATANSSLSSSSVIFLKPSSTMTATNNSTLGTYYTYAEAIVDGEKVADFKVAEGSFANLTDARAGGMFGSVNYDKNGIATVGSPFDTSNFNAAGAYKVTNGTGAHKNETVTLGSIAYTYTSDCDVWYLDVNGVLTKIAPTGITTDGNDVVYFNLNAGLEVTDIVVVEVANTVTSLLASATVKAPANNFTVKLYNSDDVLIDTQTSNGTGNVATFADLTVGTYTYVATTATYMPYTGTFTVTTNDVVNEATVVEDDVTAGSFAYAQVTLGAGTAGTVKGLTLAVTGTEGYTYVLKGTELTLHVSGALDKKVGTDTVCDLENNGNDIFTFTNTDDVNRMNVDYTTTLIVNADATLALN